VIRARLLATPWLVAASALTRLASAAPNDTTAPPAAAPSAPTTPAPAAAPAASTPAATTPAATAPAKADPPPSTGAVVVPPADATPAADHVESGTVPQRPPAVKPPSSLEIALAIGPTVVGGEAANPEFNPSLSRVGVFGELAVAYRSSYFIDPFLAVGYGALASGETHLPSGEWGAGGTLKQHLGAWTISPGFTIDIWRFRPRVGIGLAVVKQSFEFMGNSSSSSQLPLVTQLGLGFVAHNGPRFRLDIEARAVIISGAEVNFGTLDLILRGDAVYFGGG
jgi:hypothetical protein